MAAFDTPASGLDCARRIQRALAEFNAASDEPLAVRIGLHAGEPVVEGSDLFGTAVQMAARLCDAAEAGTILVSRELYDRADEVGEATPLRPIALKGFADPVAVFSIGWR